MAINNTTSTFDFSYLAVLLLLAYVMSSAPKYLKQFNETHEKIRIEQVNPIKQALKIGKAYTIDPYLRAFNKVRTANYSDLAARLAYSK